MAKLTKGQLNTMLSRTLIGVLIGITYVVAILLGYFVDRAIMSYFLCIVVAICILEVRFALGDRISKRLGVLIWIFACLYGPSYFLYGFTGMVLFTLATFVIGCLIVLIVADENIAETLMNFAFLLVYPTLIMSTLFFLNKAQDTTTGALTPYNTVALSLAFLVSCFTDMFAYFFGVLFGRHKLVPHISPKKTIEGSIGGLVGGLIGAGIVYLLFETPFAIFVDCGLPLPIALKISIYVIIGIFGSMFTQIGDLVASVVKRYCGIKDYSSLLGVHGGVMDRFDGVMFNSVFIALVFGIIL